MENALNNKKDVSVVKFDSCSNIDIIHTDNNVKEFFADVKVIVDGELKSARLKCNLADYELTFN